MDIPNILQIPEDKPVETPNPMPPESFGQNEDELEIKLEIDIQQQSLDSSASIATSNTASLVDDLLMPIQHENQIVTPNISTVTNHITRASAGSAANSHEESSQDSRPTDESNKLIDPISVVEVEYSQDQLLQNNSRTKPDHNEISTPIAIAPAPKKEVKILPKPAIGLSISNVISRGSGRPSTSTTYFIVTNVPPPPEPNLHIEVPMGKRKTRYKCSECPMIFTHKATLNEHLKKIHLKKKRFHCDMCNKDFSRKHVLASHVKSKHNSMKYHRCPKCNLEFHLKKGLNAHIEKEHRKDKFFNCPECDLEFHLRNTMITHIKNVHRRTKTFQCDQCDAEYSWKKSLNIHIDAMHKNLPQFSCDQCTSVFRWKTSLAHHYKAAHKPLEMYKFPCADCSSTFATANRLNCHRKKVHKDTSVPDLPRRGKKMQTNSNAIGQGVGMRGKKMMNHNVSNNSPGDQSGNGMSLGMPLVSHGKSMHQNSHGMANHHPLHMEHHAPLPHPHHHHHGKKMHENLQAPLPISYTPYPPYNPYYHK